GTQSETLSQFLYVFTILIFLALDGHHIFIRALAASFEAVPIRGFSLQPQIYDLVLKASGQMFVLAIKIAAPIIITLFLSNLCLGIVARTVPQVNILMIGFPINIVLGMIIFMLILNGMAPLIKEIMRQMDGFFISVIQSR
ncbi:MAG: flagellar biosynthetic protein FliR, partial [Desulfobacteraceae bacterium]